MAVDSPADPALEERLDQLLDPTTRTDLATGIARVQFTNGAAEAAEWLTNFADEPGGRRPPTTVKSASEGRRGASPPGRSALRRWGQFIQYAPRTIARLTRQTLTQPRPRTVILALGIAGDQLTRRVVAAVDRAPDPPARILVITDSLELGPLRALGVGVEYVPGRGERQAELAGGAYEEFLERRLELILAERPRARRTLTA